MQVVRVTSDTRPPKAFIYYGGDVTVMSGDKDDFRRADAARHGNTPVAWYRDGEKAWVVDDPAYLKRIDAIYAKASQPAEAARERAERGARVAAEQAALNERMAKLSQRQADLVAHEVRPGPDPRTRAEYAEGHAAIGREQAMLADQIATLGRAQAEQGRLDVDMARRQKDANDQANQALDSLIAEAVRNGVAKADR